VTRRETDSQSWGGNRTGAGRKPSEIKKEKMTFSLPVEVTSWLKNEVERRNLTQSQIVEEALLFLKSQTDSPPIK